MHDVTALIAKSDTLAATARRLKSAIVCPLVQGFALLPVTDALAEELAVCQTEAAAAPAKPIPELSGALHMLALEISQNAPVAYISTFYFGGQGGQHAL